MKRIEMNRQTKMKLLLLVTMLLGTWIITSFAVSAEDVFSGGDGTAESPWIITTAEELDRVREYEGKEHADKHFKLGNDIDLKEFIASNDPDKGWNPIGPFEVSSQDKQGFFGNFDGNGNVITGLWLNRANDSFLNAFGTGLFGTVRNGSKISNLGVIIDADKEIQGQSSRVGGLVGDNGGSIENCYSNGSVTGARTRVGGLVGNNSGSIENCYSNGNVTGADNLIGGLVGFNAGSIENCYSNGNVTGADNLIGGLAGGNNGTITASYYNKDTITDSGFPHDNTHGKIESDMKSEQTYTNWDFTDIWYIDGENEYPYPVLRSFLFTDGTGTEDSPWVITTAAELDQIRNYISCHYRLGNDIDLTTFIEENHPVNGWKPIIREDSQGSLSGFSGSLDGAGHLITGLWIDRSDGGFIGLFGHMTSGSSISNLGLILCGEKGIKGKSIVGSLAGQCNGSIKNSYSNGSVTGLGNYVGGLTGLYGNIENSYSNGDVTGLGNFVGGLTGNTTGSIKDSYSNGNVTGTGNIGGLSGGNSNITQSYYNRDAITADNFPHSNDAKSEDAMKLKETYQNWDISDTGIWSIYEKNGYPYLRNFKNNILIEPIDEENKKVYDKQPIQPSDIKYNIIDNENIKDSYPFNKALAIGGEGINAGKYSIILNPDHPNTCYYQAAFADNHHYTITKRELEIEYKLVPEAPAYQEDFKITVAIKNWLNNETTATLKVGIGDKDILDDTVHTGTTTIDILLPDYTAGQHDLKIELFPTDTANYAEVPEVNGTINISKKNVGKVPEPELEKTSIPYDPAKTLSDLAFKDNKYGTFEWVNPDETASADKQEYEVFFIPGQNYAFTDFIDNGEGKMLLSVKLEVLPAEPSSVVLTLSPNDIAYTETTTVAIAVKGMGEDNPTGEVEIYINDSAKPYRLVSLKNGKAELAVTDLSTGEYKITAQYMGDGNYKEKQSNNETLTVRKKVLADIPFPTTDVVIYRQNITLDDIELIISDDVYGTFEWVDGGTKIEGAGNKEYPVKFIPGNHNYDYTKLSGWDKETGNVIRNVSVYVKQTQLEIKLTADKTQLTYGETISFKANMMNEEIGGKVSLYMNEQLHERKILSNGEAEFEVNGLEADSYSVYAFYEGEGNYENIWSNIIYVKVVPVSNLQITFPTTASISYSPDRRLSAVELIGGDTGLGTFEWVDEDIIPTVTNASYQVRFIPNDTQNIDYTKIEGWDEESQSIIRSIGLEVQQAKPGYQIPNDVAGIYGQILHMLPLPEGWQWVETDKTLDDVGNYQHSAVYHPDDINYYAVEETITITSQPRSITLKADDQTIVFGEEVPALSWQVVQGSIINDDKIVGILGVEEIKTIGLYPITEKETLKHTKYNITFVEGALHVLANESMQLVINAVNDLADPVTTRKEADKAAAVTNLYTALTAEEQNAIAQAVGTKLESAQLQSAAVNHTDAGVTINGLPWAVRVNVIKVTDSDSVWTETSGKLKDTDLLALYDIELVNTLDGQKYILPEGSTAEVVISGADTANRTNIAVFHINAEGKPEAVKAVVNDESITFAANSFSLYGITANKLAGPDPADPDPADPDPKDPGTKDPDLIDINLIKNAPANLETNKVAFNESNTFISPFTGDNITIWGLVMLMISAAGYMIQRKRKNLTEDSHRS